MKDFFEWFCERNIVPSAVFINGSQVQANQLFTDQTIKKSTDFQTILSDLVKESINNLEKTISVPLTKCGIWKNLSCLSVKSKGSIYSLLIFAPNQVLVKYVDIILKNQAISPIIIVNQKMEILFCNKPHIIKANESNSEFWKKLASIIEKAFLSQSTNQGEVEVDGKTLRVIAIPMNNDAVVVLREITAEVMAEKRYKELKTMGTRLSLLEEIVDILGREKTDLKKIGKVIYEKVNEIIPIDTFYLILIEGEELNIEYGINQEKEISGLKISRGYRGFSNYVIDKKEMIYIPNSKTVRIDPYKPKSLIKGETKYIWSYVGIPLNVDGQIVGAVSFQKKSINAFSESHLAVFELVAKEISVGLKVKMLFDELDNERNKYRKIAITDPLTGCYTRYYFTEYFDRFQGIIERKGGTISLIMIDVDRFKTINDKYGHIVGDKVLREIGQTLTKCVRKMDLVVRYGGDEFLIMLSDTDKSKAKRIANRLAKRVSEIIIPELDEQITISFGISVYDGSKSLEDVLKIADRTMYNQKRRGAR